MYFVAQLQPTLPLTLFTIQNVKFEKWSKIEQYSPDGTSAIAENREALLCAEGGELSMPVLNGVDASRELKRIMPAVPIILFTLYADRENEILAADLLVDNVVSKGDAWNLMGNIRSLIPV